MQNIICDFFVLAIFPNTKPPSEFKKSTIVSSIEKFEPMSF
jgi:hypothetical protein